DGRITYIEISFFFDRSPIGLFVLPFFQSLVPTLLVYNNYFFSRTLLFRLLQSPINCVRSYFFVLTSYTINILSFAPEVYCRTICRRFTAKKHNKELVDGLEPPTC
ncbi:MAG: hypothetical protein VZR27_09670, partial [Acutalibacteraceae bacterium]|nr:hypothetical protein [Acutalibacteraceae bacterium]